jgi:hypothetical protein
VNSISLVWNRLPAVVPELGSNKGGTQMINDWDTTGVEFGVAEALGVGVAWVASGTPVGLLEEKIPPRSGRLQEDIPKARKASITIRVINLKNVFF